MTNAGGAGENAVEILHNDSNAMTAAVNSLNISNTTAASNGLHVDGTGGTGAFNFTSGGTNNITTTTGVGLNLNNVSIGAAGANFQNVTVNGATNGIVMNNVTGPGTVTIGANGGAAGSGGSLTTTSDAIKITNTQSAALQHIHIVSAGGMGVNIDHSTAATTDMSLRFTDLDLDAATGTGFNVLGESNTHALSIQLRNSNLTDNVNMNVIGTGGFNMVTDSTAITTTGNDVAFQLSFSGGATGNATFSGTNDFHAANAQASMS